MPIFFHLPPRVTNINHKGLQRTAWLAAIQKLNGVEKNSVGLMLNQFVEPQFDWTDMGLGPAAGVAGKAGDFRAEKRNEHA